MPWNIIENYFIFSESKEMTFSFSHSHLMKTLSEPINGDKNIIFLNNIKQTYSKPKRKLESG